MNLAALVLWLSAVAPSPRYWQLLDIISFISLIPEIPWVWNAIVAALPGLALTGTGQQVSIARAARISRVGASLALVDCVVSHESPRLCMSEYPSPINGLMRCLHLKMQMRFSSSAPCPAVPRHPRWSYSAPRAVHSSVANRQTLRVLGAYSGVLSLLLVMFFSITCHFFYFQFHD